MNPEPTDDAEVRRRLRLSRSSSLPERRAAAAQLAELSPDQLDLVSSHLGDTEFTLQLAAIETLVLRGDDALPTLARRLDSVDDAVARGAAETLRRMALERPAAGLPGLLPLLRNVAGTWSAASGELKNDCRRAIEAIVPLALEDRRLPVTAPDAPLADVLPARSAGGAPETPEQSVCVLDEDELSRTAISAPSSAVRRAALARLAGLDAARASACAVRLLRDADPALRSSALEAIRAAGAGALPDLLREMRRAGGDPASLAAGFAVLREPAGAALTLALDSADPEEREAAARMLGLLSEQWRDSRLRQALPALRSRTGLFSGETASAKKIFRQAAEAIEKNTPSPSPSGDCWTSEELDVARRELDSALGDPN